MLKRCLLAVLQRLDGHFVAIHQPALVLWRVHLSIIGLLDGLSLPSLGLHVECA